MSELSKKSALITGSTGFIGLHLTRRLLKDGWTVHVIVRQKSNLKLLDCMLGHLTVHQYNGSTEEMFEILRKADPTIVFHLASLFLSQHKPSDIEPLITSNLLFATQLIDASATQGVRCFINTGTSWQHFENKDYNPVCLYAATKQAYEAIVQYYIEIYRMNIITLMLFDTYGPNDHRPKLFNLLREAVREKNELSMSPGEQLIDLVYIDDVLEAFMIAAHRLLNGQTNNHEHFAVSSGTPVALKEIVRIYSEHTNSRLRIRWGDRPYRYREVMTPWNKGINLPGWQPKVSLQEGIQRLRVADL